MRRNPGPLVYALCTTIAILSVGCGGGPAAEAGRAEVSDSAGVQLVRNSESGAWGAAPARVDEVVRIGVLEGEEVLQFHQVYTLAVDAEGRIFVGNDQTGSVRAFTPTGEFITEFGRKGRGPGEFNMVNRVWLAGDSVVVTDWQGGGRTSVFTKQGFHQVSWPSRRSDGSSVSPIGFGPSGWLARVSERYNPPDLNPGEAWTRQSALHRFDPATDSVGPPVYTLPPVTLYGSPATEGLDWALFAPAASSGFDSEGRFYLSAGHPYRIDTYDAEGRHIRRITRPWNARPVGPADVDDLKARVTARYDTIQATATRNPRTELERVLRRIDHQATFPMVETYPPLGALLVSPDGSFWVERADNAMPAELEFERLYGSFGRARPSPRRFDLFDAAGQFLTAVDLPDRFTPMAVRGTEVTGVLKDELDVEYVVTYRAVPGGN